MSEMIERVARAAHDRREGVLPAGVPRIGGRPMRWEELPEFAREHERNVASAAIEAMREPTEAMVKAAENVDMPPCDDYSGGEPLIEPVIREAWEAMIDASLRENGT